VIFIAGINHKHQHFDHVAQVYYGSLDVKTSIFGLTLILIGLQTIFSSFYLSIIGMKNEQKG